MLFVQSPSSTTPPIEISSSRLTKLTRRTTDRKSEFLKTLKDERNGDCSQSRDCDKLEGLRVWDFSGVYVFSFVLCIFLSFFLTSLNVCGFFHVSQSNSRGQKLEGLQVKPSGLVAVAFTDCTSHQPSLFLFFSVCSFWFGCGFVF